MSGSMFRGVVLGLVLTCLIGAYVLATEAELHFATDKNGQNRVTNIQEGDEIWIVVVDNDQNLDCDVRDKMSPDLKIMDPKTGAYIVWNMNPDFDPDHILADDDYLEETAADTGVFVSVRAFQIGTRENFDDPFRHTHVVDLIDAAGNPDDFRWGSFSGFPHFNAGRRAYPIPGNGFADAHFVPLAVDALAEMPSRWLIFPSARDYILGRFENMDTLIGLYQDPNDASDVATGMMKIIDVEAVISWDQEIYDDANTAATITVVDPDENVNCNEIEYVPVFILVNPGSWNPARANSPTTFCALLRTSGVNPADGTVYNWRIHWFNIYGNYATPSERYYVEYDADAFDPQAQCTPVLFHAQETGVNTGVFQLNLNSILVDLEFNSLSARDVLTAYYIDPNDFDDFKLATAYIEERQHSTTRFTDANQVEQDVYWIGRDPVYVKVVDANSNVDPCCPEQVLVHICDPHGDDDTEWLLLDETSSNSPLFIMFSGTQLRPVWDAFGFGRLDSNGGFWLRVDNWKLEVFNEDDVYARYNDQYYATGITGWAGLGDLLDNTAFPPEIDQVRVQNDVSFDLMSIADTQVYDGSTTNMWFLDRQGNRVSGYANGDCVFIEVLDSDQDEDQYRRERINGHWDNGQNFPFGPALHDGWDCGPDPGDGHHEFNNLLGHTSIFNETEKPEVYILNPRNGYWAAVDLLETGAATGDFVSVICLDLTNAYDCVPSLYVLPGDTILAYYKDPSNHSDSAMISIKVGIGGGTTPSQQSTMMFVDADGNEVASYAETSDIFVKVIDRSHVGEPLLADAVEIDGITYDLAIHYDGQTFAASDTFMTDAIGLPLHAGDELTATYTDPTDSTDTSSDTITIIASELVVDEFYAGPNPFDVEVTFGFIGMGIPSQMAVAVYDLAGGLVWSEMQADVSEMAWDGVAGGGKPLANGAYIYVISATDGTNTFTGKGKVFVNR
jgi:hypothetical protein